MAVVQPLFAAQLTALELMEWGQEIHEADIENLIQLKKIFDEKIDNFNFKRSPVRDLDQLQEARSRIEEKISKALGSSTKSEYPTFR